ncbi:MAG: electron transfer flavoprotein subunit beta/FixA family protein [Candidatus Lokiarchaeota archaeon]|nr:electron transfer flavoprotein subunit beta/FixA family protein [Candidatus Lokiarchaeota archaeon]
MKIFVCIKQVPGVSEVRIDPKTNSLVREGIPSVTNPFDKNAIELALEIKEKHGAEVIAISMGPPQAEEVLREALAMGVDNALLLSDKAFAGADTLATSYTLALAIKRLLKGSKDKANYLVIVGAQAIDGDTGQVGPELAEELNIPQITYVQKFELKEGTILVERIFRTEEVVIIESRLPALISVLKEINNPRNPTMSGVVNAFKKEIKVLNAEELKPDKRKIGRHGSMTEVWKIFVPERKGEQIILKGTNEEIVQELCKHLKNDKIL